MVPHGLEDTNEALIKMLSAAVSDKETIANQTRIIERLTETISTLTAKIECNKSCYRNWAIDKVGEQKTCTG